MMRACTGSCIYAASSYHTAFCAEPLFFCSGHRLIVQLPLPSHINEKAVLEQVGLAKDADGFDPLNIGQ